MSSLEIVRIGTCGGLQPNTPIGTFICSETSIGFDGLLNYYEGRDNVCNLEMEDAFKRHMNWHARLGAPYCIPNDTELLKRIFQPDKGMVKGITIACGGFYGPQGRRLRIPLADPLQNQKIEEFEYNGARINNFEMESSAIAGLSKLLGHKALTVCMVVANRKAKEANANYKNQIEDLIKLVLDRI
jgi:uridine phosphorylase